MDSNRTFQRALDLIARIETAPDVVTLNAWFLDVAGEFGVESFDALLLGRRGEPLNPKVIAAHTDPRWIKRYVDKSHFKIDPTLIELRRRTSPFTWDEMEARYRDRSSQALFSDARAVGFCDGIDIPWHTADGLMGLVTLRGRSMNLAPDAKPVLRLIATYYAEVARELTESAELDPYAEPLTKRQLECLAWAAEGKTDWEISQIINVAEGTVGRHFERITARLNVGTRVQAIVIALRAGWILPSRG